MKDESGMNKDIEQVKAEVNKLVYDFRSPQELRDKLSAYVIRQVRIAELQGRLEGLEVARWHIVPDGNPQVALDKVIRDSRETARQLAEAEKEFK